MQVFLARNIETEYICMPDTDIVGFLEMQL
jgi:hypothetical protein